MSALPNPATIEALTSIWRSTLKRQAVGVNDDFFDLGGDRWLARKLFAEVAAICGPSLPPTAICEAPTIAALSVLISQAPFSPSPLALLKPGTGGTPVFLTHGIGGSVIDLVPLARRIKVDAPIYGMEARGNDGAQEPFEHIEEMAQFYLDAVQRLQPAGPYFLVGYSLGGLVALEMAQRLSAGGERVGLLAMLDSYPHPSHLSPEQRLRLSVRKVGRRAASVWKSPPHRDAAPKTPPQANGAPPSPETLSAAAAVIRAMESADLAWARYKPQFYRGKINFIRAAEVTHFPEDAAAVWTKLASEIQLETVPGHHGSVLNAHVEDLATVVSRCLANAWGQGPKNSDTEDPPPRMQRQA
ncbi:MAG TPA: alpha/beta fold hydrolase [Candidatus Nitrosotalea sp.]|nr:alpha/beta fold hydrolase [Candidatus Nitrosotalea sp.]